jgi:hypothetical protein
MISCVQRTAGRALTIPQLTAAGYPPRVFLSPCDPAGPEGNLSVSLQAVEWAATMNAPMLFVEDDIDLAPDFPWHVQRAIELDAVTYLYLNDSPKRLRAHFGDQLAHRILAGEQIDRREYEIQKRFALFGTQCVVIPQRLVPDMVGVLREPREGSPSPWDGRLHLWAKAHPEERVFVMMPHPVQHREDRTGRGPARHPMRSLSFGLAAEPLVYA